MALKLQFTVKARLWAEVVLTRGDRVFVATAETPAVGATVSLTIEAPELATPIVVMALVNGHRPATPQSPAGIVVTMDAPTVEKVRIGSGAPRDDGARISGRTEPRVECHLTARVLSPHIIESCVVKSLSASGLTLTTSMPLDVNVTYGVQFRLRDGEALVTATVVWSRPELGLAGLRIANIDPPTAARVKAAVDGLLENKPEPLQAGSQIIVVADDDPSILDFLSRIVSKAGHRVFQADRGDTALQLIRQERPRMVFLDVLMPGLDGLEVCKAIRADALLGRTPVVLLSAMGEQRLADAAAASKASDFLTKPMRLDAVRAILAKYVK